MLAKYWQAIAEIAAALWWEFSNASTPDLTADLESDTMNSKWLFTLSFLFLICLNKTSAWKRFWKGKWRARENVTALNLPQDQWFDQKLDHFNVINKETWKQVGFHRYVLLDRWPIAEGNRCFSVTTQTIASLTVMGLFSL